MVRFGLIGAGRWGQILRKTLDELPDLCQLADVATRDWQRLLSAPLDAIIVASPPASHPEIVEACVRAGRPCIVEKPIALRVEDAERLHALVSESGVPVLVDHTHLFAPAYQALRTALGTETPRVVMLEGTNLGPFRDHTPALWDWAPHDLTLCLDVVGSSVESLQALAGPDAEQIAIRLDFANGARAWIHDGRLSPIKRRTLSVFTERNVFVWDDTAAEKLTTSSFDYAHRYVGATRGPLTPIAVPVEPSPLACMIKYFVEGLNGGDRSRFGTDLAMQTTRVIERCQDQLGGGS